MGVRRMLWFGLMPVLAVGVDFHLDTRLRLGGGYSAWSMVPMCGTREVGRAGGGIFTAELRGSYDWFLIAASIGVSAYQLHMDSYTQNQANGSYQYVGTTRTTEVNGSGTLRIGVDLTWWSIEGGVALPWLGEKGVAPSVVSRIGPKTFHLKVYFIDQCALATFYPADTILGLLFPSFGVGTDNSRWFGEIRVDPVRRLVRTQFLWYLGAWGVGGELTFGASGNLGRGPEKDGTLDALGAVMVSYHH